MAWAGLVLIAVIAILPLIFFRRASIIAAGIVWFCIFFIPVANFLMPATLVYGERLLYLPMLGLALAAVEGARLVMSRNPRMVVVAWLLAAFAAGNALAIQVRHGDWRSTTALVRSALPLAPDSVPVLTHNARLANSEGDFKSAVVFASRAISLQSHYAFAYAALGVAFDGEGKTAAAEDAFQRALKEYPSAEMAADYGTFLARHGRLQEALTLVQMWRQRVPDSAKLSMLEQKLKRAMVHPPQP